MWSSTESPTACSSAARLAQRLLAAAAFGDVADQAQHRRPARGTAKRLARSSTQIGAAVPAQELQLVVALRLGAVADALLEALRPQSQELRRHHGLEGQADETRRPS